jgi:hypothetical protein
MLMYNKAYFISVVSMKGEYHGQITAVILNFKASA